MKTLDLYLETSVWNFVFADDSPDLQRATKEFFDALPQRPDRLFISNVVTEEFERAGPEKKNQLYDLLKRHSPRIIQRDSQIVELANSYIKGGVFTANMEDDALHVAHATAAQLDAVVSWNLRHIANLNRQKKIQAINLMNGYDKPLSLITPMELLYEIES